MSRKRKKPYSPTNENKQQVSGYEYKQWTLWHGIAPTEVRGFTNLKNMYHANYLMHKIYACFDIDLDEEKTKFPKNFFRFNTFIIGCMAAFKIKGDNWIIAPFSVLHRDIYYNPKIIKIALINYGWYEGEATLENEFLVKEFKVGEDAVIFKAFDNYQGFADLIFNTSSTLANLDKAINLAIQNNNCNFVGYANDEGEANNIKAAVQKGSDGEPVVIVHKDLLPEEGRSLLGTFANTYPAQMLDKLYAARRTLLNNFLTEIGINNANVDKKERLNSMEVNSNSEEVAANVTLVYDNLKKSFEEFNKLAGAKMSIDLHFNYENQDIVVNDILSVGGESENEESRTQLMGVN